MPVLSWYLGAGDILLVWQVQQSCQRSLASQVHILTAICMSAGGTMYCTCQRIVRQQYNRGLVNNKGASIVQVPTHLMQRMGT